MLPLLLLPGVYFVIHTGKKKRWPSARFADIFQRAAAAKRGINNADDDEDDDDDNNHNGNVSQRWRQGDEVVGIDLL